MICTVAAREMVVGSRHISSPYPSDTSRTAIGFIGLGSTRIMDRSLVQPNVQAGFSQGSSSADYNAYLQNALSLIEYWQFAALPMFSMVPTQQRDNNFEISDLIPQEFQHLPQVPNRLQMRYNADGYQDLVSEQFGNERNRSGMWYNVLHPVEVTALAILKATDQIKYLIQCLAGTVDEVWLVGESVWNSNQLGRVGYRFTECGHLWYLMKDFKEAGITPRLVEGSVYPPRIDRQHKTEEAYKNQIPLATAVAAIEKTIKKKEITP